MENFQSHRVRVEGGVAKTAQEAERMLAMGTSFSSFLGLDEGSLAVKGLELDCAEAPRNRDPFSKQENWRMDFYYSSSEDALELAKSISKDFKAFKVQVSGLENQDWNAEWRKHFQGLEIGELWSICPPESAAILVMASVVSSSSKKKIILNPGMGFGAGSHPTTYLMLESLGNLNHLSGKAVLDFGAGSGILSIAAALQGARVCSVEIDSDAIENARENAFLNELSEKIIFSQELPSEGFDLILANILFDVLDRFSTELIERLLPGGQIWLSGFFEQDSNALIQKYQQACPSLQLVQIQSRESWSLVKLSLPSS